MANRSDSLTNLALLLLRLVAGAVIFYYGCQKFLGVFGGAGFSATLSMFQKGMGIPPMFGALAIIAEFFGGLGLLLGALSRIAAFGIVSTMAVAVYLKVTQMTTLVADFSSKDPAVQNPILGPAYPLLVMVAAAAILLMGPGDWSVDKKLFGSRSKR